MRHLGLAHFLAYLRCERAVELSAEFALLSGVAIIVFRARILPCHIVQHVVEHRALAQALRMLAAVLATIHLGLVTRGDGRAVTVALDAKSVRGHMAVHDLTIPA